MYRICHLKSGRQLKGLYYREQLTLIPKIDPKIQTIQDQRSRKGKREILVSRNGTERWEDLENFFFK